MKITIDTPFLPGTKVLVENYKSTKKPWEPGTIQDAEAGLYIDGSYYLRVRVLLDRRSNDGRFLYLHVGNSRVKTHV